SAQICTNIQTLRHHTRSQATHIYTLTFTKTQHTQHTPHTQHTQHTLQNEGWILLSLMQVLSELYSLTSLCPSSSFSIAFIAALYIDKDLEYVHTFMNVCFFPRLKVCLVFTHTHTHTHTPPSSITSS